MCGIAQTARQNGMEVTVYLIGDGVLCAKKDQKGYVGKNIRTALENGTIIKAGENDLHARAIPQEHVQTGIEMVEDIEGLLVEDIMENSDRVISW
jgi:sulfur relay protein TusB/DsrH